MDIIYSKNIKDLINKFKNKPDKQKEITNLINDFGVRMINEDFGLIDPNEKKLMISRARRPEYDQDLYGKYLLGSTNLFNYFVYIYYDADTDKTYAVSEEEFKNYYQADWTRKKEPEEWYQYIIWYDFEDPENYKETGKSMKVKQPFDDDVRVQEIYEKELGKPVIVEEDINERGHIKYQYKNKAQWNPKSKANTFLRAQTHEFWKPHLNENEEIRGNEEERSSIKSEIEIEQLYPSLTPKLAKEAVETRLGAKYQKELDEILKLAKDKNIDPDKVYKVIYDFLRRRYYNEEILKKVKEDLLLEKPQMFFNDSKAKKVKDVKLICEDINDYEPWSEAVKTYKIIVENGKLDALDALLEELYPDGLTFVQLNDLLWFDDEWVLEQLGLINKFGDSLVKKGKK